MGNRAVIVQPGQAAKPIHKNEVNVNQLSDQHHYNSSEKHHPCQPFFDQFKGRSQSQNVQGGGCN